MCARACVRAYVRTNTWVALDSKSFHNCHSHSKLVNTNRQTHTERDCSFMDWFIHRVFPSLALSFTYKQNSVRVDEAIYESKDSAR